MKSILHLFLIWIFLLQGCGPFPRQPETAEVKNYLGKAANKLGGKKLANINENYYLLGNVSKISDAQIIYFGDRKDSKDSIEALIKIGNEVLEQKSVVLFEGSSPLFKSFKRIDENSYRYVLSEQIIRNHIYQNNNFNFDKPEDPEALYQALEVSLYSHYIIPNLKKLLKENLLLSPASPWQKTTYDGWNAKFDRMDSSEKLLAQSLQSRNQIMLEKIDIFSDSKNLLVSPAPIRIPSFQIAWSKLLLIKSETKDPTAKKMIEEKSITEFYKLCGKLPNELKEKSNCMVAENVFTHTLKSEKKFIFVIKKKSVETYSEVSDKIEAEIFTGNLMPTSL
jgi:hypothetical protein